ncbi:MAG: preprotein translocase subunit SecE [bacterium]|nr:preprotein translocase subunit SecE [bacterium]
MAKTSPAQFVREVRQEINKVTWPTRKEGITTSIMVFVMALISALFFLFADTVISSVIRFVLGFGG